MAFEFTQVYLRSADPAYPPPTYTTCGVNSWPCTMAATAPSETSKKELAELRDQLAALRRQPASV